MRGLVKTLGGLSALLLLATGCSSAHRSSGSAGSTSEHTATVPSFSASVQSQTNTVNPHSAPASAPAAAADSVDVCSLLSSAQASSLNNVTYGAATPRHLQTGFDTCTYANSGKHASPIDIQALNVQVISIAGCFDELKSAEGPGTKVSGVGDDAFGYQVGMVTKVGSRCIEVSGLTVAELDKNYAPDTAMTKIIIGHLH